MTPSSVGGEDHVSQHSEWETAREILERYLELLLSHDMEGIATLWASDGIVEWPFVHTPSGNPLRIEGQTAIRSFLLERGYSPNGLRIDSIASAVVHESRDADWVIVELELLVTQTKTGESHSLRSIQLVRTRNGKIAFMRDYTDPLAAAAATGRQSSGGR